jgi:hypothetical protein
MKYILLLLIGLSCSSKAARSYIASTNNTLADGSPSKAIDLSPYLSKDSIAQYNDTIGNDTAHIEIKDDNWNYNMLNNGNGELDTNIVFTLENGILNMTYTNGNRRFVDISKYLEDTGLNNVSFFDTLHNHTNYNNGLIKDTKTFHLDSTKPEPMKNQFALTHLDSMTLEPYNDTFDMSSLDVPSYKIIKVNPFSDTVKVENDLLGIESNYDTILNKNDTIYLVLGEDHILKSPAVPLYDTIKTIVQYIDTASNHYDVDVHWRYVYEVRMQTISDISMTEHIKYLGLDKKELPKNFLILN